MLQHRFSQTYWNLTLRQRKKDDLSEMPGYMEKFNHFNLWWSEHA